MNSSTGHQKKNRNSFGQRIVSVLIIMISGACLFGCAVESPRIYVKDGKAYGRIEEAFRSKWWNYYERGLSFAEGSFFREAETDLREAILQRSRDQRMARTYGMHFIDYFPHRELGIICYLTGNLETANRELELSLDHFPSAKASFYLDRVRKILIERKGAGVSPPNLTLDFQEEEIWTREDPLVISGIARDENYVSGISIRGVSLFSEGSKKEFVFREMLRLSQGRHEIEVSARNLPGKETTRRLIIHADREGPVITLSDLRISHNGAVSEINISGSVYDEAGVSGLNIGGKALNIQKKTELIFTRTLSSAAEHLELLAQDRLGNQTSARIPLKESGNAGQYADVPENGEQHSPLIASAAWGTDGFFFASLFGSNDKKPPDIQLKDWEGEETVFLEKIYLEGKVSDETEIVSLTVNGTQVLRREGKYVFFAHLVDLEEGKNEILIQAGDRQGNTGEKKLSIIRKIPKALQLAERLSVTVFPFGQSGDSDMPGFSVSFQNHLTNALVNRNRFRVLERDKLDILLQEQKLSRAGLTDQDTALRMGKLIAATSVITGNIIESRNGIEIVARMIDTETSEILASQDVYDEMRDIAMSKTLSQGLAVKFHREFPLLDGLVVQQKGDYVFLDTGQSKVRLQRRFIAYREEPIKHPVSGKILGADNVVTGHVRITQVTPALSKARILDREAASIRPLDKVISE